MKRLASYVLPLVFVLLCGCRSVSDYFGQEEPALLVNLDVSVALSDISDGVTRAGYADAEYDNEKMHKLRIVIVRPDWTVEANRVINLQSPDVEHGLEKFEVVGNETKLIYLFVNEDTEVPVRGSGSGEGRKLVDFDFNTIKEGYPFPAVAVRGLQIRLEDESDRIDGPLPMCERHEYHVTAAPEQECRLFVTRAAVKFTFHIINESANDISVGNLAIDKMAHVEWYMPNVTYAEPADDGQREILQYEVPAGAGYYTYVLGESEVTVPAKEKKTLGPVYLLEGKYIDGSDFRNYSIKMALNGMERSSYFPDLSALPRNTHVVVNITVKGNNVVCEADVIPYSSVPLEPEFGL